MKGLVGKPSFFEGRMAWRLAAWFLLLKEKLILALSS